VGEGVTVASADAVAVTGIGDGDRDTVGKPVAVVGAEPAPGSSVTAGEGSDVLVGDKVPVGTSVCVEVGGRDAGLVAVGVLVAPVGVMVGMVWFSFAAWAASSVPQAARRIASVSSNAKITARRLISPFLIIPLP